MNRTHYDPRSSAPPRTPPSGVQTRREHVKCYYTRLLVGGTHGRRYILRIRRDLDEGAPLSWVRGALRVAHQFGTEDQVRPKVEELVRYAKSMPPRRPTRRR